MRYALLAVPFAAVSVFTQPLTPAGENADVAEVPAAVEAADAAAMAVMTMPELFTSFGMGLFEDVDATEKRDIAAEASAQKHGKCKNKMKMKWKSQKGHHCKVKCKHGRCHTSGDGTCKTSQWFWDYPSEHHFKLKWQGPNGEDCKEHCLHGKCKVEGPAICQGGPMDHMCQIMWNEQECGRERRGLRGCQKGKFVGDRAKLEQWMRESKARNEAEARGDDVVKNGHEHEHEDEDEDEDQADRE